MLLLISWRYHTEAKSKRSYRFIKLYHNISVRQWLPQNQAIPGLSCLPPFAFQVHELTAELEQLPRRAQLAAGFITYLSSAPEDVRKATMARWCEAAELQGFDFRRFMSTESEQLGWKAEGLPSDDLSMENALVILKVSLSTASCS